MVARLWGGERLTARQEGRPRQILVNRSKSNKSRREATRQQRTWDMERLFLSMVSVERRLETVGRPIKVRPCPLVRWSHVPKRLLTTGGSADGLGSTTAQTDNGDAEHYPSRKEQGYGGGSGVGAWKQSLHSTHWSIDSILVWFGLYNPTDVHGAGVYDSKSSFRHHIEPGNRSACVFSWKF